MRTCQHQQSRRGCAHLVSQSWESKTTWYLRTGSQRLNRSSQSPCQPAQTIYRTSGLSENLCLKYQGVNAWKTPVASTHMSKVFHWSWFGRRLLGRVLFVNDDYLTKTWVMLGGYTVTGPEPHFSLSWVMLCS